MKKMMIIAAAGVAASLIFSGCSGTAVYPQFDGSRAFTELKRQVDFGCRVPGTPVHAKTADYLTRVLGGYADEVTQDKFTQEVNGKTIQFRNIYATFNKNAKEWILLSAHWDTRPIADEEIDYAKRDKPIPGANDGASGVAVLLEIARLLHEKKPNVGVFMVLFDGEDYGPSIGDMFIGSERFAKEMKRLTAVDGHAIKLKYGILLDMVGDKDLQIYREQRSMMAAPAVVDKVWKAAADLGYSSTFIDKQKYDISDDHIPLIAAGLKTIDVIDFDYGPWHTLDDNVRQCSPQSLEKVGRTITKVVYDESGSAK